MTDAIFLELLLWVGIGYYPLDSPGPFSNTHLLEGAFIKKNCVYNLTQAFLKTFRLFDLQNDNLQGEFCKAPGALWRQV